MVLMGHFNFTFEKHHLKMDGFPLPCRKKHADVLRFCLHAAALTAASGGEVSGHGGCHGFWENHP